MNSKHTLSALALLAIISSCRPKPLDIEVPQSNPKVSITSVAYDNHTVFVSVGYSASSMTISDTSVNHPSSLPAEMQLDSATVIVSCEGKNDTLHKVRPGLYGSRTLNLNYSNRYTLIVIDHKYNSTTHSTTSFIPKANIGEVTTYRAEADSLVDLNIEIKDANAGKQYFVSYCTAKQMKEAAKGDVKKLKDIQAFEPKRLELLSGSEAKDNVIKKVIRVKAEVRDTLIVQIAQIENAHYKFLQAYKKTGYLINQLTGEPINLPTNIEPGFGYFSLYQPYIKQIQL